MNAKDYPFAQELITALFNRV